MKLTGLIVVVAVVLVAIAIAFPSETPPYKAGQTWEGVGYTLVITRAYKYSGTCSLTTKSDTTMAR